MGLLRAVWSFAVGVKDALVLLFLLLFFGLLWAALSSRTPAVSVPSGGALVIALDGALVDQATPGRPLDTLVGGPRLAETQAADVVKALRLARDDDAVKAVVLDLDRFMGGGRSNLQEIAAAMRAFRASGKPLISYATVYTDDSYLLAAHASEAWINPVGQFIVTGPGGSGLYFKGLIDRLKLDVEVFRVGTFKSAVEPFTRTAGSPEARAADQALVDGIWRSFVADVQAARRVDIAALVADWPARVVAAGGDSARAAVDARLVDRMGDDLALAKALRERFGAGDAKDDPRDFKRVDLRDYLAARAPLAASGAGVGVVHVAGNILDGESGAGSAGGDTIATLIHEALANDDVKALVVRVDSPGGSVLASEQIRRALLMARERKIPVVASFGPVAASGGYWIATAADTIYAQPTTITGSIGVFGLLPTFERTLADVGVTTDTIQTTTLSGQPDLIGGLNAPARALLQSGVADTYRRFVGLVAAARKLPIADVERVAEGRVWTGADALRLRLIDRYGGLDAAIADAAKRAGLPADARVIDIKPPANPLEMLLERFGGGAAPAGASGDAAARLAYAARLRAAGQVADALTLARTAGIHAQCLACAALGTPRLPPRIQLGVPGWLAALDGAVH